MGRKIKFGGALGRWPFERGAGTERIVSKHDKKQMRNAIIAVALCAGTVAAKGQGSFLISEPAITTCQASLQDTGGEPGGGYQNNESFTTTICADTPGQSISLDFGATPFNLSTAGTSPLDQLSIYDGDNTSAPLIGTWTGSSSPGIITASFGNTTGCLTVSFTSNETGTGRFAAFISCTVPCEPPTAVATFGSAVPLLACQGEVINFDGSGSTAAQGFGIDEYKWDFDDGAVDSLTGSIVSHAFAEPGEYVVQLYLTDGNNCASTNLVDLQVLVSTTPSFAATSIADTTVCQGSELILDATGTAPTLWSATPVADFGDGIYLPDDQSQPFNSSITFNGFAPNATLSDIGDLLSVCLSIEHSYMGDLVIYLTCPNGQNVYFHQQGGGGTFLGEALDGETDPPTPGTCWDYCFDPTATNGTWASNTATSPLPAGSYASVQPMSQLVGCPLNGTWTLTVNDLFGIDDGFLCSWQVNFDPSLYPDLTEFTPDLGFSTLDSSIWSGPNVEVDSQTPLIAAVTMNEVGTFDYVFSVTDNFGCTYDTTMTVTVLPSPQAPILISGDNILCDGAIAYLNAPGGYDSYVWNNGFVGQNISAIEGTYTVTVAYGECELESEPFPVTLAPSPQPQITGPGFSCGGEPATLSTTETYASYQWSNGSSASAVTVGTGSYTVTVTNAEGCTALSPVFNVTVGADPQAAFSTNPVSPQGIGTTVNFSDLSSGNGAAITSWDWNFGTAGATSSQQSPSFTFVTPGEYGVTLTVTTADGCTSTITSTYVILPEDVVIPNVFTPNGDGSNEYFVIENGQYFDNTLSIFNRWGQEVYETKNYRNTWRASDVPEGTYYYVFRTAVDGKEYTGHVTILR